MERGGGLGKYVIIGKTNNTRLRFRLRFRFRLRLEVKPKQTSSVKRKFSDLYTGALITAKGVIPAPYQVRVNSSRNPKKHWIPPYQYGAGLSSPE